MSFGEDIYTDDLVIIADSLEECVRRLLIWKEAMEKKGLRVNAGKTKVMWYRPGPLAEFRRIPMRCLSYMSIYRQQQHLLQWLQTLFGLKFLDCYITSLSKRQFV